MTERPAHHNLLEVVQQGATAYAVDQTAGTVHRVDGATFELTQPEAPIPDARSGLTAIAGPTSLYTVDTQRFIDVVKGTEVTLDQSSLSS